jgi:hypothetical protein
MDQTDIFASLNDQLPQLGVVAVEGCTNDEGSYDF